MSLFDSGSETELSQDIPEGPVQASGLSDVSGQAAKAHSRQLKKAQAGGFPKEVWRQNYSCFTILVTMEQAPADAGKSGFGKQSRKESAKAWGYVRSG